jgi:hypothetical protein
VGRILNLLVHHVTSRLLKVKHPKLISPYPTLVKAKQSLYRPKQTLKFAEV